MKIYQHFFGWIVLVVLFIPLSIYMDFSIVEQEVIKERQQAEIIFGSKKEGEIITRSIAAYQWCCADAALSLEEYYISDDKGIFNKEAELVLESIWGSLFQVIHRFFVYIEWFGWLWPVVAFLFIDAWVNRKIRNEGLTYQNTVRCHLGKHGVVMASGLSLAYLFFPFSVSLVVIPVVIVLFSYSLYVAISNIHRML